MSNTISDFLLLKIFNIQTKDIIWQVLYVNWLKMNIDDATKGCHDIFRGSRDKYVDSSLALIYKKNYKWFNILPPCNYLSFFIIIVCLCFI